MASQMADDSAYLAGYVAECGVKAVILKAGIRFKRHLHELSTPQLLLAADLSFAARRFPLDLDPDLAEIQATWTTDLRYVRTGAVAQQQAEEMLERAQAVFATNDRKDGLGRLPRRDSKMIHFDDVLTVAHNVLTTAPSASFVQEVLVLATCGAASVCS